MTPAQPGTRAVIRTRRDGKPVSEWSVPVIAWAVRKNYGMSMDGSPYVNDTIEPVVVGGLTGPDIVSFYLADFANAQYVGITMADGWTSMDATEHAPGTLLPLEPKP